MVWCTPASTPQHALNLQATVTKAAAGAAEAQDGKDKTVKKKKYKVDTELLLAFRYVMAERRVHTSPCDPSARVPSQGFVILMCW